VRARADGEEAKTLNSLERVQATLSHQEPDKVPFFDFLYNRLSLRKFVGQARLTRERIMRVWLSLGFDIVCPGFDAMRGYAPKRISRNVHVNEWGVKSRFKDGMSWYVDGSIKGRSDLDGFVPPDPEAEGRTETLEWALREHGDRVACAPAVSGAFTQAWTMTGFATFARALHADPSFAHRLLRLVNKYSIEMGRISIDLGARLIWIADDYGGSSGPMISPAHFRTFILPLLKTMVGDFKRRGAWVLLHCDGNVASIVSDIVGTGVDAFHPIERKAGMDLGMMKARFGDIVTLIGNLEASHLIPWGRPEQIDEQIRECLSIGAPGSGYIFASDHSIHPAISAERARFVFSRAGRYRRYRKDATG